VAASETQGGSGKGLFGGFLALAVLLALVGALVWGIARGLSSLQPGIAAAVVTASATVLISVFSVIYSKRWERRRMIEEGQRVQKLPLYEDFVGFMFRATFFDAESMTEADWKQFVGNSAQKLSLWAADDVISAYNNLRRVTVATPAAELDSNPAPLLAFEQLLLAIRKDLGHNNKGLTRADLLRLFITDIDEFLPAE
jgi:hypothetical protein